MFQTEVCSWSAMVNALLEEKPCLIRGLEFIKKVKNGIDAFATSAIFDINALKTTFLD